MSPILPTLLRPVPSGHSRGIALTSAERILARRLGEDITCTQLANALGKRPETVRSQLKALYRKLGVRSRHAAVDLLHRAGWFTHPGD